jgi:hypothetical protein
MVVGFGKVVVETVVVESVVVGLGRLVLMAVGLAAVVVAVVVVTVVGWVVGVEGKAGCSMDLGAVIVSDTSGGGPDLRREDVTVNGGVVVVSGPALHTLPSALDTKPF